MNRHEGGGGHRLAPPVCHHERLGVQLEGLAQAERLGRLPGGLEQVVERTLPVLGTREVVGEHLVVLGESIRVQLLDGPPDESVQLPASLHEEGGVGHVLGQRVLEHVRQLGEAPALVDQLERGELAEEVLGPLPDPGEAVHEATGELPSDHRRELERPLGRLRQPVDARGDHVLDGGGNVDLGHRPGQVEPAVRPPQGTAFLQ